MDERLQEYGQEQLLRFYNELSKDDQKKLLDDIASIDFEKMKRLYDNREIATLEARNITFVPFVDKEDIAKNEKEEFEQLGAELIKKGELAICSMAGGQGTRLGFDGPKGTYILNLEKQKSIFEILVDKLKEAYQIYGTYITWYIMTSKANDMPTKKFFEEISFFGYPKEYIIFFQQGELPLLDLEGKMILEEKNKVYKAADGNGGIFEALCENHILDDMKNKNISYLCIGNVDNILIKQVDALLLGMMKKKNYDLASKSIVKKSPTEKVGVFCKINGQPSVIEYIDLSETQAEERNEAGELLFGEAYFGCCIFSRKLLEKIGEKKLPFHAAKKKNKYLGENGELVVPTEPNTYKFEAFIFDGFKMADDILIMRVKRKEEFAPIKNKEGEDSPDTARKLYMNYYFPNIPV